MTKLMELTSEMCIRVLKESMPPVRVDRPPSGRTGGNALSKTLETLVVC